MRTMLFLLALTMPAFASGFITPKGGVPPTTFTYAGHLPPLGYFDPLGVTVNRDESTLKYLREAELQHGRVAMMSFLTLVGLDITFPKEVAINHLSNLDTLEQTPYWFGVAIYEVARMLKGWTKPTQDIFALDDAYQPGNVFGISEGGYDEETLNKELSNGRLAMIGCAWYMAQELIQQTNLIALK